MKNKAFDRLVYPKFLIGGRSHMAYRSGIFTVKNALCDKYAIFDPCS